MTKPRLETAEAFSFPHADCRHYLTRGKRVAIKIAIMNSQLVMGVGNIYTCEALFRAGGPCRKCGEPVKHRVQGQRSTYYCGSCQH